MTVSTSPTWIDLPGNGTATVFSFPFLITATTDLLVGLIVGGQYTSQSGGYSVSGVGNSGGGQVTFSVAPSLGTTVDLRSKFPFTQPTNFSNLGGYLPESTTNSLDRVTSLVKILARQTYAFGIHGPDSENVTWPALPSASVRANTGLVFDNNGLPTVGALTSVPLTPALVGQFFYPTLPGEIGVVNNIYPYGCPRRFGAVGNGVANDTTAVQNAINSSVLYWGWQGDSYGVTSVIWPANGLGAAHFNGSRLVAISTTAQNYASQVRTNRCNFYDYLVDGGSFNGIVPNSNYASLSQWFNPTGASQFNNFFGHGHTSAVRGWVYGGLPGQSSSTIVHSENRMYGGWTNGVSNPFYCNSSTGFVHHYGAVFFRDASTWTVPNLPAAARALEVVVGNVYMHGGELIASNSLVGFAADLNGAIIDGTYLELSAPLNITGDNNRFLQCRAQVLNQGVPMFHIDAAATGVMAVANSTMFRPAGTGATDRSPLVDGTAAPNFEVDFNDTTSFEWGFAMAGANVKLIQGCVARYSNHRLSITAADPNVYRLNDPKISLIPDSVLDHMGYAAPGGWVLETISGGGSTLTNTTVAGPSGFLSSQLTLHATGQSRAWSGDPSSLATLKNTAYRVRPSERFWLSGQVEMSTLTGTAQLLASFYDITGAAVSTVLAADNASIGQGAWVSAEGPIPVPATAAYMLYGVQGIVADVRYTDVKVQKA